MTPETAAPPYARLFTVITELRKSALILALLLTAATLLFYNFSASIFAFIQLHLDQELVFFTVAEPFLAHLKLAIGAALFCLMPLFVFFFWQALAKPFKLTVKSRFWFGFCTCFLFYSGTLFCYFITLPYGIKFLLGFSSTQLQALISIGKFVSFVTVFVLAFGVIFELPIIMVFCARSGIIPRRTFEKNRRYALLAISIIAALLTPTPDVVNMLLMGAPLYTLYELGIVILKVLKIDSNPEDPGDF